MSEELPVSPDTPTTMFITNTLKKWKCSRGHEWEGPSLSISFSIPSWPDLDQFCIICLRDWCKDYVGRVKEGK